MDFQEKAKIMDAADMKRTLDRMATEIVERNNGTDKIILVGIHRRGVPIAQRMAETMQKIGYTNIAISAMDISFYRDDLSLIGADPVVKKVEFTGLQIQDRTVVLVDDVLFTGRTVRAGINEVLKCGNPKRIQLAVLIDRGHREFPIYADYVGKHVPTQKSEIIKVMLNEIDAVNQVLIVTTKQ